MGLDSSQSKQSSMVDPCEYGNVTLSSIKYKEFFRRWMIINSWWTRKDLPGHRHGKLFIGRPCKRRAEDLLKLSMHQLKMAVVVLMGHASVRRHLYIMGLSDGDPTCRFCRVETETVQHIICCCEVLACQRYNVFGELSAEPKDINTASVRDLCVFIRGTGLLNLCWMECLGLHNKPKAEAHLGHLLTGPREEEEFNTTSHRFHENYST
jgi:hypothetical protein